jgi:serine/threonine-protein kinase PRP4
MVKAHLRHAETTGTRAHFDGELRFLRAVVDPVTKAPAVRAVAITEATEDLTAKLLAKKAVDDDKRVLLNMCDLLGKMFVLDPQKRISVKDALAHPFIRGR